MGQEQQEPFYDIEQMESYVRTQACRRGFLQTLKACDYAREAHRGQLREEGIPYIIHPLQLAFNALRQGMFEDELLAVMLLHDVCEDCGIEVDALPFSDAVRRGVGVVTFLLAEGETKQQARQRYYEKITLNREGILTKIFDRCHNISTMAECFTPPHMKKYMEETRTYIMPLIPKAMELCPEYAGILFGVEYHMKSVLAAIEFLCCRN